jgi:hypothetical protein
MDIGDIIGFGLSGIGILIGIKTLVTATQIKDKLKDRKLILSYQVNFENLIHKIKNDPNSLASDYRNSVKRLCYESLVYVRRKNRKTA